MAYEHVVLADSPRGYWKLDETSGTTAFDSTDVYDGVIDAAVFLSNKPIVATSKSSMSPTTGNMVNVSSYDGWDGDFSLEVWFRFTKSGQSVLLRHESVSTWGFRFGFNSSNLLRFWTTESGGTVDLTGTTTLQPNTTYHAVVIWSSEISTATLYLNASSEGDGSGTLVKPVSNGLLIQGSDYPFSGYISDVAAFSRILTADEISEHYAAGTDFSSYAAITLGDGPEAYYQLDDVPSEAVAWRDEPDVHEMKEGTLTNTEVVSSKLQLTEASPGVYNTSGNRVITLDLSVMDNIQGSHISWTATTPTNTTVTVETSTDGTNYTAQTSGASIATLDSAIWGAGGTS